MDATTHFVDPLIVDAKELQELLTRGSLTSVDLIDIYTQQIREHDDYLKAVISSGPEDVLLEAAQRLDQERSQGKLRGPVHGIPILIKDNIDTHPDLGMQTTAGSFALAQSMPSKNARVVDKLIDAGAIILGKCNLSELSNWKGHNTMRAWSAVGGQTQSAYTRGDVDPKEGTAGHNSPAGSSSGSAVAVSAGFAPFSIGTETDGSLVVPAGRAALYTIKPTIGLVSQESIVPVSHTFDSAGPMAKTPYDMAILLDAIVEPDAKQNPASYTRALTGSWSNICVATLDPEWGKFPDGVVRPVPEATEQMNKEIREAYAKIQTLAKDVAHGVPLIAPDSFYLDGEDSEIVIIDVDFVEDINQYLQGRAGSPIKNLGDLIDFNKTYADWELPQCAPNQDRLLRAHNRYITKEEYRRHLDHVRDVARSQGVDYTLEKNNADVIIGPADSRLTGVAAGAGYPIATLPLGYLEYNGQPFGLAAIAKAHQGALLIEVQSAWEATFGPRQPPVLREKESA